MNHQPVGRWVCVLRRDGGAALFELVPEAGRPPPAIAEAQDVSVVFDGLLTDRRELETTLGDDPPPASDADLVLAAYRRFGGDCLSRLSGIFALVLWDGEAGRLLCARDPIGIHPLLYSDTGATLVVGSFVEPILEHPDVPTHLDRIAVCSRILEAPLRPDETLFAAVRRIPPGHALDASSTGSRVFRYWDPGEPGSERGLTLRDAVDRFESLLRRAVDRSVAGNAAAVFLSGGIDSALVATVATRSSRESEAPVPLALALMLAEPDVDEEANQRAIAADLGLELVPVSIDEAVGPAGLLRATLAVTASGAAGPADLIQPIYDQLAREGLRRGRTTFMNGQGGDEWLLPPPLYAADRLWALDLRALWQLWHASYRYYPRRSKMSTAQRYLWTLGARPFVREAALRLEGSVASLRDRRSRSLLARIPSWLAPETDLRRELVERMLGTAEPSGRLGELARNARRGLLDRPDRPGITEDAFTMPRRLGVRLDMPLLDADLVGFLHRLPADLLVHGGQAKALARAVVSERLPSFGGGWPSTVSGDRFYRALINRETVAAWRHAGETPYLAEADLVDVADVRRRVEAGSSPASLWPATNVDVWLRACLDRPPPGDAPP